MVQATSPLPKGDTPQLFVLEKNATKKKIDCTSASISFKTKEDIANPLDIESYTLAFTGCEIKADKAKCTADMQNAGVAGTLDAATGLRAGVGVIKAPVTLKVECETVMEQCEYKTAAGKPDEVRFRGGSPAEMYSLAKPIPFSAGKNGCFTEVQWFGDFEVTQPKAVWVTN
jgi:hypothetical protein